MRAKRYLIIVLAFIVTLAVVQCSKGDKGAAAEGTGEVSVKESAQTQTPFDQIVTIFKGFENIVDKNRGRPDDGVKACKKYAEENIPKIKSLETKVKDNKDDPTYIDKMMETNRDIKEINDNITKIVTESYGVEGAEVLMQLSDMALARM